MHSWWNPGWAHDARAAARPPVHPHWELAKGRSGVGRFGVDGPVGQPRAEEKCATQQLHMQLQGGCLPSGWGAVSPSARTPLPLHTTWCKARDRPAAALPKPHSPGCEGARRRRWGGGTGRCRRYNSYRPYGAAGRRGDPAGRRGTRKRSLLAHLSQNRLYKTVRAATLGCRLATRPCRLAASWDRRVELGEGRQRVCFG